MLGREVAIKSLRPELLNDNSFVERFRAEATSLARLNHPNITTLYALLPEGGNLYMVMELVRGRTLEVLINERSAPFNVEEALAIISQAADGLAYAHEMGVVHRDIKPANMIVTDGGLLKIMDFGIARVQGSQRFTRDGSIVGTLAYMSPEQLRAEEVDARTDLYSLAIVLYEMLSGSVPFTAASDYDLMRAQISTAPERLTKVVPGIDPQVDRALMRALAKKPADRYPSLTAFKEALGHAVSRTEAVTIAQKVTRLASAASLQMPAPVLTAVSSIAEPARKFSPALRGLAIGAAAAIVVAAAFVLFLGPRPALETVASPATTPAPLPPPSQQTTSLPKAAPAPAPQSTSGRHPLFPATRQQEVLATPSGVTAPAANPARQDANRPFQVAAEPSVARPAAKVTEATAPQTPTKAAETPPPAARVAAATPIPPTSSPTTAPPVVAPASSEQRAPSGSTSEPATNAAGAEPPAAPRPEPPAAPRPEPQAAPASAAEQRTTAAASSEPTNTSSAQPEQPMTPSATAAVHPGAEAVPQAPRQEAPAGTMPTPAGPAEPAAPAKPTYAEIKAAYDLKDYPRTRDLAEPLAKNGDADAQFIMARLHHIGGGMRKDEEKAVAWYRKAAEQGHGMAQYALGIMYERGDGVLPSKLAAAEWYHKAATRGVPAAQFNLGVMFAKGEGVNRDLTQAKRWLTEASKSSDQVIADKAEAALEELSSSGRRRRR